MLELVLMTICNTKVVVYPSEQQNVSKFYTTTRILWMCNFRLCAGVIHRSEFDLFVKSRKGTEKLIL
jgi:hypothetical protein